MLMAASRSMGILQCMWRIVSPVSLVLVIVNLNAVLLLLRHFLSALGKTTLDEALQERHYYQNKVAYVIQNNNTAV